MAGTERTDGRTNGQIDGVNRIMGNPLGPQSKWKIAFLLLPIEQTNFSL